MNSAEGLRPASPPPEPRAASRRVLLVEDCAESRETMEMLLTIWGHQVETASDGGEGVQKALAGWPDVAVVDLGLPVLDGYQVARQLRAALGEAIYLIALSGYAQAKDRERALEAGFNAHLCKPAELDELSRLLTSCPD
jgi:CheY-like chemotaxis protein